MPAVQYRKYDNNQDLNVTGPLNTTCKINQTKMNVKMVTGIVCVCVCKCANIAMWFAT